MEWVNLVSFFYSWVVFVKQWVEAAEKATGMTLEGFFHLSSSFLSFFLSADTTSKSTAALADDEMSLPDDTKISNPRGWHLGCAF